MWTTFGSASEPDPLQLEAILGKVSDWRGKTIRYCAVGGGISNMNWRVHVEGVAHDFFVKIPGRGTGMFIDRLAAHEASVKAQDCGYGATVEYFLEEDGVEICRFLDDFRSSGNLDFARPNVRVRAVKALRAFNDMSALRMQKTIFDMIAEHVAQVRQLGGWQPPDMDWMLALHGQAQAAFQASGLDLVPCMNDTLAGNFMLDANDEVRLIDFEYASNNERAYELALWFGEMFFDAGIERELIEVYQGSYSEQTFARIQVLRALADLKWATWAMVQEAVSTLDFDFRKYGVWKYFRARGQLRHPHWNQWLRTL